MKPIMGIRLAAALLCAVPAAAQDVGIQPDGWRFTLSPYLWLPSVGGQLSLPRGDVSLPGASGEFNADLGDLLSAFRFGAMLSGEARSGRFGLLGDFMTLGLEKDVTTRGVLFDSGEARLTVTGAALIGLYRVVDSPSGAIDIGAGIRPWWISTKISLNAGRLAARSQSEYVSWVDPVIAVRGSLPLSPRFGLSAYADVGGFGAGSELTYQAVATIDYRAADWVVLRAGWRHLGIDFQSGRVGLDTSFSGPILGATFRF